MNSKLNSLSRKKLPSFWKFFVSNIFSNLKSFISNSIFNFKVHKDETFKCLHCLPNKHRLSPHLDKVVPLISMKSMVVQESSGYFENPKGILRIYSFKGTTQSLKREIASKSHASLFETQTKYSLNWEIGRLPN